MPTPAEIRLGYDPNTSLEEKVAALEGAVSRVGTAICVSSTVLLAGALALQELPTLAVAAGALIWAPVSYLLGRQVVELQPGYYAMRSGLAGELAIVRMLQQAFPDWTVIQNQLIPNKWSRTGHTEIDIAVVGKHAIYLVEVKNNKGTIYASDNKEWVVESPGGAQYTMRNASAQVISQAKAMRRHMAKDLEGVPILPMVVFPSCRQVLDAGLSSGIPVFSQNRSQIPDFISTQEARFATTNGVDVNAIVRVLGVAKLSAIKQSEAVLGQSVSGPKRTHTAYRAGWQHLKPIRLVFAARPRLRKTLKHCRLVCSDLGRLALDRMATRLMSVIRAQKD